MKAKRVDNSRVFEPVTIELTFETQAELEGFWHRMNIPREWVGKIPNYETRTPTGVSAKDVDAYVYFDTVWSVADEILRGLS